MLARTRLVLTRVGVRQYSSVPGHGKVYALPFRLKEDRAKEIINVASYVNQHAFLSLFTVLKSVTHRNMLLLTCLEYSITCLFFFPDIHQNSARCQAAGFIVKNAQGIHSNVAIRYGHYRQRNTVLQ